MFDGQLGKGTMQDAGKRRETLGDGIGIFDINSVRAQTNINITVLIVHSFNAGQ